MSVAWVIGAALLGLIAGALLRGRSHPNTPDLSAVEDRRSAAQDRALLLHTLRRELANYMVRRDPDRFLRLYQKAHDEATEINEADKTAQVAKLTVICDKYPYYTDLDLIMVREHVLYEDAVSWRSIEEIEAHYIDLVNFHALQRALNEDWETIATATSDSDLEHLEKYAQKIKDTKFKQRITDAVDVFYRFRDGYERIDDTPIIFENDVIQVQHAYHIAEFRYGIYFKDTDEYGLYSFFVDDDRDKTYYSYYRSDHKFENEGYLETLIEFDGPMRSELN
jgi:hypothetical protein